MNIKTFIDKRKIRDNIFNYCMFDGLPVTERCGSDLIAVNNSVFQVDPMQVLSP